MRYEEIIAYLKEKANPEQIESRKARYGIISNGALGLTMLQLNNLIKSIKKDETLALQLYQSGIYEGRVLCGKLYKPKALTMEQAEAWSAEFENWEITDTYSMKLFAKSPLALEIIDTFAQRAPEFQKRSAFATLAAYCCAEKKANNEHFLPLLDHCMREAQDQRLYVKKAISWAMRSMGKRNRDLQQEVIVYAQALAAGNSKSEQWIAKDVLKELENPTVRIADYPRSIYRPTAGK